MLLHDGPLTSQPQEAVEVDWGNPLAAGLVYAQVGANPTNIAGASAQLVGQLPREVSQAGEGLSYPGSASNYIRTNTPGLSGGGTGFVLFRTPPVAASSRAIIGAYQFGGYHVGHYISYDPDVGKFVAGSTASENWTRAISSQAPTVDADCALVGRFVGGGGRDLWQNGVLVGTDVTARSVAPDSVVVGVYCFSGIVESPFVGTMYCSAWWNRVLTDDEVRAVSANPWQLFRVRQVWLPAIAAPSADVAGSVALGLTATGSIAVAKPVSGTVAVALATSGSIAVAKPVAGGVGLALSATGAIAVNKPVAGAVAIGVACSGALTVPKPVAGSVAVGVTAAGSVAVAKPVAGAVAMALTTSGALTSVGMGGAVAVSVATAGSVAVDKPVSGAVLVSLTTAAALTVAKPVSGAVVLSLTTTGRIETATLRGLVTAVLTLRSAPTTLTLRPTDATLTTRAGAAALTLRPAADAALQFQTDDPV